MLGLLVAVSYYKKVPFCGMVSVTFFILLCSWLMISLFKMTLKYRAKMLSSVSKVKKAVMCLLEKIHVMYIHLGINYRAICCEFK